jgi:hypothetical protein
VGGHTSFELALQCIWALCLIFVTFPLVGASLSNSPCLSFGYPALFLLRFLMWVPLLQTHLALHLGMQPCPGRLEKVNSKSKFLLIQTSNSSSCLVIPCVAHFRAFHVGGHTSFQLAFGFHLGALPHFCYDSSCGCPSFQLSLPCLWEPCLVFIMIPHVATPLAK